MKLLKGKKDLIPQKSKLNLSAHRSRIKRSMLCCLHQAGGAKGRAMGRSGREGAAPFPRKQMGQMPPGVLSLVAPRVGKHPLCFRNTVVAAMGNVSLRDGGKLI